MKKKIEYHSYYEGNVRHMACMTCGRYEVVGDTTTSLKCSRCVLILVGFPEETKTTYKPTGRPPGWHFMAEFVDKDGNVFHKGKEIKKLKGTLQPTKVKPPKKKTKRRSKEQILIDRHNEKKAALKKAVKKQKDFLNHKLGG